MAEKFWENDYEEKRFLQVSTDEVYGILSENKHEIKFYEQTPLNPPGCFKDKRVY